jgi:hypothetical protein
VAQTLEACHAAYLDSADYSLGGGSVAKAQQFVVACRRLLLLLPKSGGHAGANISLNPEMVQGELQRALGWIAANDSSANSGVTHLSLQEFRQ